MRRTVSLQTLVSLRDLAETLGVTPRTIHTWATIGINGVRLKRLKIGRLTYFDRREVDSFIAAISGGAA